MKTIIFLFSMLVAGLSTLSAQRASWGFELHGGAAYNPPMPLSIRQNNQPEIRFTSRFETRPFEAPVYWVWRVSRWENKHSWEFEAIHHKLYLVNGPQEVEKFTISHGYNILMVNHAFQKPLFGNFKVNYRLGAGIVLAHPESRIRHMELDQHLGAFGWGYYISGPVFNFTLGKRFYLWDERLFLNTEAKFTPSWARVPVVDGNATMWNLALQFAVGMGFNFIKGE